MKKALSYILLLVIFVQALFTPVSLIHAADSDLPTAVIQDISPIQNGGFNVQVQVTGTVAQWSNVYGYDDDDTPQNAVPGDNIFIQVQNPGPDGVLALNEIHNFDLADNYFVFGTGPNITVVRQITLDNITDASYTILVGVDRDDVLIDTDVLISAVVDISFTDGVMAYSSGLSSYGNQPVGDGGAQNSTVSAATPAESSSFADCGLSASGILACIINILTLPILYLIYWVSSLFVSIIAQVADFVLFLSINDALFRSSFVEQGWALVRDIANLGFIFVLLITAFQTVLGIGKSDIKKVIANVIIIAVCINFSLFISKVVIDAGNVVARIFYSRIEVEDKSDGQAQENLGQEKAISIALVSQINPQKIMGSLDTYTAANGTMNDSTGEDISKDPTKKSIVRVVIFIIVIMINFSILFTFTSVTWLFIGRILELWLLMITGPLAFISYISPHLKVKDFDFSTWFSRLLSLSFMPAVYCFFLYIIIKFFGAITSAFTSYNSNPDNSFWATLILAALPVLLLMGLIDKVAEVVESFAGTVSKTVKAKLNVATGAVGMAGAGIAAKKLRNTVGKYSSLSAEKRADLEQQAAEGSTVARMRLKGSDYLTTSSFDVRNTGMGQAFQKKSGFDFNTGSEALKSYTFGLADMGSKATEGGYQKAKEDREKKMKEKLDNVKTKLTDEELENVDTSSPADREAYKKDKKKWDTDFEAKVSAPNTDPNSFAAQKTTFLINNPGKTEKDYTKEMYKEFYSKQVIKEPALATGNNKAMKEEYLKKSETWEKTYRETMESKTDANGFEKKAAEYKQTNPGMAYTTEMYKKFYTETLKIEEPKKPEYRTADQINSKRTEAFIETHTEKQSTNKVLDHMSTLTGGIGGGKSGRVATIDTVIQEAKKEEAKKTKKRNELEDKKKDLKTSEGQVKDEIKKTNEEILELGKTLEKIEKTLKDTQAQESGDVFGGRLDTQGNLTGLKTYKGVGLYPGATDEEKLQAAVRHRNNDIQDIDQKISDAQSEMQRYSSTRDGTGAQQYKDAQDKAKALNASKTEYKKQVTELQTLFENKEGTEKEIRDQKEFIDRKERKLSSIESQKEQIDEKLKNLGGKKDNKPK